jgi:hypothetical protein
MGCSYMRDNGMFLLKDFLRHRILFLEENVVKFLYRSETSVSILLSRLSHQVFEKVCPRFVPAKLSESESRLVNH